MLDKKMVLDEVLQCPACKASAGTMAIEYTKDGRRFLRCTFCFKKFTQNKDNNFFLFFTGERKSEGSSMTKEEMEGSFFTNKRFRKFCMDSQVFDLRQTLARYEPKLMLDIGCGTGEYALYLKGLYQTYYGLEPFYVPGELAVEPSALPENAVLVQYDSTNNLPVNNNVVDMIVFIASYDHIPNPKNVIQDTYCKLKDGGYLLIMCSNYNFWAKRFINKIRGKKMFQHQEHHFSVYSPDSLINEIKSFVPVQVEYVNADSFFLPNLPKIASFFYFSTHFMVFVNRFLYHFFSIVSMKNAGSGMVVVFRK